MKALTLTQPWATLVAIGAKKIETRSWRPRHRGLIAIHAAKTIPPTVLHTLHTDASFRRAVDTELAHAGLRMADHIEDLPRGMVIATAVLVDVVPTSELVRREVPWGSRFEHDFGDYSPGRWAWFLGDVQPLSEPVPARGALGLWDWTS